MDMAQLDRLTEWVRRDVPDGISRDHLQAKADGSALPQEAKRVLRELPEGTYTRDELVARLRAIAEERFGAGVSGSMAGRQGGGGIFGE